MTDLKDLKELVQGISTSNDARLLALAVIAVAEQIERLADSQAK